MRPCRLPILLPVVTIFAAVCRHRDDDVKIPMRLSHSSDTVSAQGSGFGASIEKMVMGSVPSAPGRQM